MSYKYFLIVLEYLTISLHFEGYLCQKSEIISSCTGENLQLDCGEGGKIAIERVFFGAKNSEDAANCFEDRKPGCCQRGYGDCIFYNRNTESVFKRICSGRRSCLYPVRVTSDPQCSSDYMTVYYQCIPDSLTGNICSDDEIHAKSPIYLSNVEYPLPRTGESNCTCMIVKSPMHQLLDLKVIELHLFASYSSVQLTLRTADDEKVWFPINYRLEGYRSWTTITSDNATISLLNTEDQGDAYIWIEITSNSQSEEPISLYCGESLRKLLFPTEPLASSTTESTISTTLSTVLEEETSASTQATSEPITNAATATATKEEHQSTTEIEVITFSGTVTPKLEQSTTKKPTTTLSTTTKPTTTQSTTTKPTTTQSTTPKPTTTQSTTTQSTTKKPTTTTQRIISTSQTLTTPSTTFLTSPPIPEDTKSSSTLSSTQELPTTSQEPSSSTHCFETCHATIGNGFTMTLKSFMNPSKAKKFCGKIDGLITCFENNMEQCTSSPEKEKAQIELNANLAGRRVICENNLDEIENLETCYKTKSFRRELTACDQLLYPFEGEIMEEKCMLKRELVDCVQNATENCNDDTLSELVEDVSNELFDYLYKTKKCDQDSMDNENVNGEKAKPEPSPEPETPSPEPENSYTTTTTTTTGKPVAPSKTDSQGGNSASILKQLSHFYCLTLAALSVGFSYF